MVSMATLALTQSYKISGRVIGVEHHFQQFFSYILTTKLNRGRIAHRYNELHGYSTGIVSMCLETLTH
jgi:hypothetical protein